VIAVAQSAVLVAILGTAVVFGTDVFCALVMRPALARVEGAALASVMGNVHRYGDRRMPVPGVLGLVGSAAAVVLGAVAGHPAAAVAAGSALIALAVWLVLYVRISAPINRVLTATADRGETPEDVRELQAAWDRVITLRATLQGVALVALALALIVL
jgi:hypothetical protein